ncbi:unnamed protein product (macronuclear) [Paramecium tetraurelia]|uniref:Anti-silencing factor n=1 Tax=Paramecium tetraurelia TaxID=5888 RepID=A0DPW8_PARTE|nr:uncharacterized protein GSPATT00002484001 [Paramecium tetraurelia]CAK85085.1 unnamed protein product [Paramecium tetraurelia]|eukprot:XP_001452482.1 hypothetical protein (macronuclear) [Paramecium tetraurelia strain d4-2]
MALINITNIVFDQDTALFNSPIQMQITFDVMRQLDEEIEWKLIYIGSPNSDKYDQVLEQFSMPPLQQGTMQFTLMSSGPNFELIPSKDDLFGASAIILSVKYRKQEFFRVGYYVYNTYLEPELIENDPPQVLIDRVYRQINTSAPRVTRINIDWEGQMVQLYVNPQQNNQSFMFQQQPIFNDITNTPDYLQQTVTDKIQQPQQQQQQYSGGLNNNQYTDLQSIF